MYFLGDSMITVVIAFVIIASVAVVAYPLFKSTRDLDVTFVGLTDPVVDNLIGQRDATYAAIKDLEFDHTMGKLSDADYKMMRAKYETKAVVLLQELDNLGASQKASGRIARTDDSIEREVGELRRNASSACPKCGTPHAVGDVFCAKCGTSLRGVRCPACGKRASLGDQFCAKCGATIK